MTCPDEMMLQSYLDGELSAEMMETAAAHVFSCSLCSAATSEIKNETFLLDAAFEKAFSAQPPTEKLRARLDAQIAAQVAETIASVEQLPGGGNRFVDWRHAFAAFFALPNTRRAAFACVAAMMLVGSFLFFAQSRRPTPQKAANKAEVYSVMRAPDAANAPPETQDTRSLAANIPTRTPNKAPREIIAPVAKLTRAYRTNLEHAQGKPFAADTVARRRPPSTATEFLPGEQSYLKAIASLSVALKVNGEKTSSPARIDYKRDLAIVDDAINMTRREAKRHPRDTYATEFMLAAYQSKLDLLDTIASASR